MNKRRFKLWITPLIIIIAGYVGMRLLSTLHRPPGHKKPPVAGMLVSVIRAETGDHQARIEATGVVAPLTEAVVSPQVQGRVVWVNRHLQRGEFFSKGEELFRIDQADYRLALERTRASVASAELDLESTRQKAAVARREWERHGGAAPPSPLVVYEPQLRAAQAALEAARAEAAKARLDLERTSVRAPFDCVVLEKRLEVGQYVKVGAEAARVVGTNRAQVVVQLSLDEFFTLPPGRGAMPSAQVCLRPDLCWKGVAARTLGEVQPLGKTVQVAVEVDDPYRLGMEGFNHPRLEMGSFVHVRLAGKRLTEAIRLPRGVVRDGGTLWLVSKDETLEIRKVEVGWEDRDWAYVVSGLSPGELVVSSDIPGAAPGMRLKVEQGDK